MVLYKNISLEQCKVVPPSLSGWAYAISLHGLLCLAGGVPCGILLYYCNAVRTKQQRTIGVVVGIVAAASMCILRPVIESHAPTPEIVFFGPFVASSFGFATFFKACNAAFSNYPEGADEDLKTWLLWFTMLPEPAFSKGKLRGGASRNEVLSKLRDFVGKILALCFLLTLLIPRSPEYELMDASHGDIGDGDGGGDGIALGWLQNLMALHVNGFVHLWLLYSFASFCLDFSTLINYILSGGLSMEPAFCNPLLESRSFTETWGTRWNRPVNLLLKRTVYVPAMTSGHVGRTMAAVLTFLASGLLHEYNFSIHNHRSISSDTPGGYRHGEITVFFLVMGFLMVVESHAFRSLPHRFQNILRGIPSVVTASMLTFLVAGISERYFLRPWIRSGFLETVAQMLPHLDCR